MEEGGGVMRCSIFGWALLALSLTPAAYGQTNNLGTNLTDVSDYSPQLPFTDIFKFSRDWFTQCGVGVDPGCNSNNSWDTGEAALLDLDANGWVQNLPARQESPIFTSVATFWDFPSEFPAGRYIVTYNGQGTIQYGLAGQKINAESLPGRDVININPANGGLYLRITETDPNQTGNYLRNIKIFKESDESKVGTEIFSDIFLNRLSPYSTLRFMDWMRTNYSTQQTWSDRPRSSDARYSSEKGVPLGIMIALANKTDKSPWFNMPHQATHDYIQNFAIQVKSSLKANLKIYVEYSNEVWNPTFTQGGWVEAAAESEWPGGSESGFTKRINYHGKRTAEICDIWRNIFAEEANRVVCVLASQAANSWTADEALSCPLWSEAPCKGHGISAIAIAPYFGDYIGNPDSYSEVSAWLNDSDGGLQSLFSEISNGGLLSNGPMGGALQQSQGWIEANIFVADSHGVDLITYEGGQHLVGVGEVQNDDQVTSLFTSANRDARMGSIYSQYLADWQNKVGGLFVHFNDVSSFTKYGSWGALEKTNQLTSSKYDALLNYATGGQPEPVLKIQIRKQGRGKVKIASKGITCKSSCETSLGDLTETTIRAIPNPGFKFLKWKGACTTQAKRCVVSSGSNREVIAVFKRVLP